MNLLASSGSGIGSITCVRQLQPDSPKRALATAMTHDLSSIRYNPQSLGDRAVTGQGDFGPGEATMPGGGGTRRN